MSSERPFYAVLLYPQAVEALGAAITPHLREGDLGPHLVCKQINTSGALFELRFDGQGANGKPVEIEMMLPHGFIRMVLSVRGEDSFGFSPGRFAPPSPGGEAPGDPASGQ